LEVYTCGAGNNGRLGHGDEEQVTLPTLITSLDDAGVVIHEVAAGGNHVIAIDWLGKVWVWGFNNNAQLGLGHFESMLKPVQNKHLEKQRIVQVAAGETHSIFSNEPGEIFSCGWGHFCGHGEKINYPRPEYIKGMKGKVVRQLMCGRSQCAVVTDVGDCQNWGIGACGQLGHNHDDDSLLPDTVLNIQSEGCIKVACGSLHSVFLTDVEQHRLLLQDLGFKVQDNNGMPLLHRACLTNCLATAKYLVEQGANTNVQDAEGRSILHVAVLCGSFTTTTENHEGGPNTATLDYMLSVTNFEVFDIRDNQGMDCLELAMRQREYPVGMILLNYYANNYEGGRVDQAHAAMNNDIDYLQMVFSDQQSAVATDDLYSRNALYWAVAFAQVDAVRMLRTNKYWINQRDFRDQTPLYVCAFGNTDKHVECCKLLLEMEARTYFAKPDIYGKQPGDYADYPPMIAMLNEYVQITLCMDYSYPTQTITSEDLQDYLSLAKVVLSMPRLDLANIHLHLAAIHDEISPKPDHEPNSHKGMPSHHGELT